jgi:hypothetical protein
MKENIEYDTYGEKFSFFNIHSLGYFLKNNIFQLILLFIVFIIVYVVDRITNHNMNIMALHHEKIIKEQLKQAKKHKNKK